LGAGLNGLIRSKFQAVLFSLKPPHLERSRFSCEAKQQPNANHTSEQPAKFQSYDPSPKLLN
jgi:hypothetical protein